MAGTKYGLRELRWIADPGHAWLEVPTADVEASGYKPSQYSYIDTYQDQWNTLSFTYLEEDQDARGFIEALGVDPADVVDVVNHISYYNRSSSDCFVRDLPNCSGYGYVSPFDNVTLRDDTAEPMHCARCGLVIPWYAENTPAGVRTVFPRGGWVHFSCAEQADNVPAPIAGDEPN